MAEEFVLTPGGIRRKSLVHRVEQNVILDGSGGRLQLQLLSGEVLADLGVIQYRPKDHPLMPRNILHPTAAVSCEAVSAFGSGWITFASWTNNSGTPLSLFSTRWIVPAGPATESGQTIFIFNGIQNSTMIYQPVLQWGMSAAGGGDYWSVACWYVDGMGGPAFFTNLVPVNTGDSLTGVMRLTGQSTQGFSYDCQFQGIANTSLPIQNVQELTWCIETLECYGITKCTDYPASKKTEMTSIDLQTGNTRPNVVWLVNNSVVDCGQHTLIFNNDSAGNGEVDLWYSASPFWTSGFGTIAPGEEQEWRFSWGGDGDVGPQLIQAEPLNASAKLRTTHVSESLDTNGHLTYYARVQNDGSNTVSFQWRGGGR